MACVTNNYILVTGLSFTGSLRILTQGIQKIYPIHDNMMILAVTAWNICVPNHNG